jgi:hypothetical protein
MADLKRHEELTVITKTYDLILWSCHHTSKFLRNHRFVLGERIERNLYDLLETLLRAKYTRQRKGLLEQANLALQVPRARPLTTRSLRTMAVQACPRMPATGGQRSCGRGWRNGR